MRFSALVITSLLLLANQGAGAQQQTEYELQHQLVETQRQAVVAANFPLTDADAEKFWDLYRDYRNRAKEMDDARVELLKLYAENFEHLDSKEAASIVSDALRVEAKRQSLKKNYMKKFSRVLSGASLFRYYQIETKMDAMKLFGWTQRIPLAPVDK